jgi:hypothetical protein
MTAVAALRARLAGRSPVRDGIALALVLWIVLETTVLPGGDAHAYWAARGDLYSGTMVGGSDAYLYAPPFAQLMAPLQVLSWPAFHILWGGLTGLVFVALVGPLAILAGFLPPVLSEFNALNIHVLLAGVAVVGFRYPALWSFALLTKVTPGVGLLWFAVRREWHNLGLALGATALISGVSFALAPGLWADWIGVLLHPVQAADVGRWSIDIPLLPRLLAAAAVVTWGARTDRRWTVPVAMTLGLPVLWTAGLTVLIGAVPLARAGRLRAVREHDFRLVAHPEHPQVVGARQEARK